MEQGEALGKAPGTLQAPQKWELMTRVRLLEANIELDQMRGKETLQRKCKKVERGWEREGQEINAFSCAENSGSLLEINRYIK